ncbi:hypothetical protein P8452_44250 [Trifolium repens]|nr:hypothetical protein P8452_44250 [Trifolium repens]
MEYKITREIRLVVTTGKKFGKDLGNCGIFLKMMLLKRKRCRNERGSVQSYIQKKTCDDKKICYLAPYFNNHHWQLLIINPTKLEVVFLCSLGKSPDKKIYEILDTALATYNKLQRARKQKKVDWLFPTSQKQKASYECGYFIMIHHIVSATLVGSWTQIFGDSQPFQKDEVKNVPWLKLANGVSKTWRCSNREKSKQL